MLLSIALRNLARQRARALLTLASVGVGVVSLILAAGFIDDILWQLREATIRSQVGHFQVFAPGYIDSGRREPLAHTVENPREAIAALRSIPGVVTVGARLSFPASLSNGRADVAIIAEGVEPAAEARIGTALTTVAGESLERAKGPAIVIGEGVAASLKLRPGDAVTVVAATRDGALNTVDAPVAGAFRGPFKDYDDRAVRLTLADAQELAGVKSANALVVLLDPDASLEAVLATARRILPRDHYDIHPWWDLADFYQGAQALYRRQFLVLLVIVSAMVVLGVANSINMSLHERQAEFGTVRAMGYKGGTVLRQILGESAVLGIVAALIGVAVGILLAWAISALGIDMPPPPGSEKAYTAAIRLSGANIALAAVTGVAACVAGAILPARRLSRMPIVDALRRGV
jgi:putative ABC transport system permease protein